MPAQAHGGRCGIWAKAKMKKLRLVAIGKWNGTQRRRKTALDRGTAPRKSAAWPEDRDSDLRKHEPPPVELSRWSQSRAKRILDVAAVLLGLPIVAPLLVLIALAVFVTSGAPLIFRQRRMGRHGVPFAIYKFRTMQPAQAGGESAIAAESANRVTWLGSLLRRSKLDELPQIFNVLAGKMSLVGPRPKVPEQQLEPLPCRPGLTGAATLAFACEGALLMQIPPDAVAEFFHNTILPAKRRLDTQYMRKATLLSDLRMLVDTVLGRWESYASEIQWITDPGRCQEPSSQAASMCP